MKTHFAAFAISLLLLASAALAQPVAPSSWTQLAPMPDSQVEAGSALLNGKIYVMGGWHDESEPWARTRVYDIATNVWSEGVPTPTPIHHNGVVALDGKIWLLGGFTGKFGQREPVSNVWVFDPASGKWDARAPMPSPRGAGVAAAIGGLIYVAGGEHRRPAGVPVPKGAHPVYEPIADLVSYDPKTDAWKTLPPMNVARDHAVGGAMNGKLYVIGGRDRPVYDLTANEAFDPARSAWTSLAPMPTGRSGGNGAALDGKFFVFGGEGYAGAPSGVFPQVEAYNAASNSWIAYANMPLPRHSLATVAYQGKLYLPGGSVKRGGSDITGMTDAFEPK